MARPVILWKNILTTSGAILTASSTSPDFSVYDIATFRPWKIWKSAVLTHPITIDIDLGASPADADMLGLVNSNIGSQGGTVEVFYGSTFPPTNSAAGATTPDDDDVTMIPFTAPGSFQYWRVTIDAASDFTDLPFIGELWLGLRTTFPEFPDPDMDMFMQQDEVVSQRSTGGQYLGAILRGQQHRQELKFGGDAGMPRSFFTSDLNAFYKNHAMRRFPFFFQFDADDADFKRAFFLKVPDQQVLDRLGVGGVTTRFKGSLWVEEAWMPVP